MQELTRKFIHLVFGLGIAGIVVVLDRFTATAILAGGLFIGIILVDLILRGYTLPVFSALVNYVDRNDPLPGKGALYFAVSALVCVILFSKPVVIPALVSLAVLDGVATIAGIRFGRNRIPGRHDRWNNCHVPRPAHGHAGPRCPHRCHTCRNYRVVLTS